MDKDLALVYGSGNEVRVWSPDMKRPVTVHAEDDHKHITSVVEFAGAFLHVGYDHQVTLTGTSEQVMYAPGTSMGLAERNGSLVAIVEASFVRTASTPSSVAIVYDLSLNQIIAMQGLPDERGLSPFKEQLRHRPYCLDMAVAQGIIYVGSENVVAIDPGNKVFGMTRLSEYLEDEVKLASDGERCIVAFVDNDSEEMLLQQLRDMRPLRRVPKDARRPNYHPQMVAIQGDSFFMAGVAFDPSRRDLVEVDLDDPEKPPVVLCEDAWQAKRFYATGNPMIVTKRDTVEYILRNAS